MASGALTTTTGAKMETIKAVFEHDDIRKRFYDMLGQKAPGFIVSVINTISNDRNLANADRNSILFAAATAATLDLPINPNLGFAYIVAYLDRHSGMYKAQFQMGYKGFVQLAQRSGQFKTIAATPIYEGQLVEENPLTGFKFDFTKRTGDAVIGYAGYFQLVNGFEKTLYMTVAELKAHGLKYSQSYKKGYGLWEDNFDAMAQKTVLKLLLSKFAPLSIEMQKAVLSDQAVINNWEGSELEHPDNAPVNPDDVAREKEEARIRDHIQKAKNVKGLKEAEPGLSTEELKSEYQAKLAELSAAK